MTFEDLKARLEELKDIVDDSGDYDQDEFDPDGHDTKTRLSPTPEQEAESLRIYALEKALWLKSISHQTDSVPMTGTQALSFAEQIVLFLQRGIASRPQEPVLLIDGAILVPSKRN